MVKPITNDDPEKEKKDSPIMEEFNHDEDAPTKQVPEETIAEGKETDEDVSATQVPGKEKNNPTSKE